MLTIQHKRNITQCKKLICSLCCNDHFIIYTAIVNQAESWGVRKKGCCCSSANKVQTNVFRCCLIVNYGVALHRTCCTTVCIVPWHYPFLELLRATKSAWDVFGVNFWSRDFLGGVLLEALGIVLGLDFWLHSIIPITPRELINILAPPFANRQNCSDNRAAKHIKIPSSSIVITKPFMTLMNTATSTCN